MGRLTVAFVGLTSVFNGSFAKGGNVQILIHLDKRKSVRLTRKEFTRREFAQAKTERFIRKSRRVTLQKPAPPLKFEKFECLLYLVTPLKFWVSSH